MNKIITFVMMVTIFLIVGYIGGSSFSWLFVVIEQKIAAMISFVVGFIVSVITLVLLLGVINDKTNKKVNFSDKINAMRKPSEN